MSAFRRARRSVVVGVVSAVFGAGLAVLGPIAPAAATTCDTSWNNPAGGNWTTAADWSAGVPTATSNACITLNGVYSVTINGVVSAGSLTLGGTGGKQGLEIVGSCGTGVGELEVGASSTIGAKGVVQLTDTTGDGSCGDFYAFWDQTAGMLMNAGGLEAVGGGTDDRRVQGNVVNTGLIRVDDGTTFHDLGGTLANNAGTIAVTGSGLLAMDALANYTQGAGTTSGTSTAPVLMVGGDLTYAGAGASTITVFPGSANVRLSGNLAAHQTLTLQASCNDVEDFGVEVDAAASFTNRGTINLTTSNGSGCFVDDSLPAVLSQQPGNTLTNAGTIHVFGPSPFAEIDGSVTNSGTIRIDDGSKLSWDTASRAGGTFTNRAGTIEANGSATLSVFAGFGGSFIQGDGTTSGTSTNPVLVYDGTLAYTGTGASTITTGDDVVADETNLTGNVAVGQTLTVRGQCDAGAATVVAGANWTNRGTVNLTDNTGGACGDAYADLYQSAGTFTNMGTIHVIAGSTSRYLDGNVNNKGMLMLDAGTTLDTEGGTFKNLSTGTIETNISAADSYGQLYTGTGAIELGGTLAIVSPYTPPIGATFAVVSCTGCEPGGFATITGQALPAGLAYGPNYTVNGTTLTVAAAADLSVSGFAPPPVHLGSLFNYVFTVQNAGPNTATGSKLVDRLPGDVTYEGGSPSCTAKGAQITCHTGKLLSGASVTVTIKVMADAAGSSKNTATVSAKTVDLTPADASTTIPVTITQ